MRSVGILVAQQNSKDVRKRNPARVRVGSPSYNHFGYDA